MALAPATFRGVPFAVIETANMGGRRLAVHQYPGKEIGWAQDMGKKTRRFMLRGFVLDGAVKLGGKSIDMQRSDLIAACEKAGTGTLKHPTMGELTVALDSYSISEGLDASNYSDVSLECVESGQQTAAVVSTAATTNKVSGGVTIKRAATPQATRLKKALVAFAKSTIATLLSGKPLTTSSLLASATGLLSVAGVRSDLVGRLAGWTAKVLWLAKNATALYNIVADLVAPTDYTYGRYSGGANSGLSGKNASNYSADATVLDLTHDGSVLRQEVTDRAQTVTDLAASIDLSDITDLATAIVDMIDALLDCCADPADAIRILLQLLSTSLAGAASSASTAVDRMVQQAAAAALTNAVARYQPSSTDDAAARIAEIAPVLDALAVLAADAGADDVSMLRNAAATKADLQSFSFAQPLPALLLAQQIYGDATRADQLVGQVDPPHPLFFPASFQALSS
jgi:prophage DNA circulation protein